MITFKNLASRPYSLHAVGVSYWKASEGELGNIRCCKSLCNTCCSATCASLPHPAIHVPLRGQMVTEMAWPGEQHDHAQFINELSRECRANLCRL